MGSILPYTPHPTSIRRYHQKSGDTKSAYYNPVIISRFQDLRTQVSCWTIVKHLSRLGNPTLPLRMTYSRFHLMWYTQSGISSQARNL